MSNSVARGASRMGMATLLSRIFGLVREQVFAGLFGASHAADAFNIAFRIPNLLRDLFAEGAMSAAFVPNFTKSLVQSKTAAFRLLFGVLSVLVAIVSVLSVLGIVFSEQLVGLYASSYKSVPGKFELAVGMTKIMFPFFPLVAMAAVVMGALNALGYFFLPAFAPVLFNFASILSGLVLCPLLARFTDVPPIYGMAIGVLLGGFLQFFVQWIQIVRVARTLEITGPKERAEYFQSLRHPLKESGVKHVLWLIVPGTVGLAATQLNILINSVYATSAGQGAVSWLNYAFRLMQFPIGIFGVSLAAATLPLVSRKLVAGDRKSAAEEVGRSLAMTFSVNGPAAAGLMVVGLPIVQLLFQHGKFGFADSQATADAVFWYGLGLPGYSVVKVLVPIFYALGSTRVPVLTSFLMVALNAILNHVFQRVLGYPFWALAMATSVTATLNAVFLIIFLQRKLPGVCSLFVLRSFFLHGVVSALIGVFAGAGSSTVAVHMAFLPDFLRWSLQISVAVLVALVLWLGLGKFLKIEENLKFLNFIAKKLRRSA